RWGLDRQQWLGMDDVRLRSLSTLGNASMLGSYLVWVLPFTAAWTLLGRGAARRVSGAVVCAAQIAALATTLTRGAWLGALAAALVFALLWLGRSGRRRWVQAAALGGVLLVAA